VARNAPVGFGIDSIRRHGETSALVVVRAKIEGEAAFARPSAHAKHAQSGGSL
jgi:hypothetical protein